MKILMVSIPNHHFFQWVNQLKESGHEVYWFDSTDGGSAVEKINWVHQIKGWKLRWDFPFRNKIKSNFPKWYAYIQKINERDIAVVFDKKIKEIQPDIVHCFEMQLAGLPILAVMDKNKIPFIYSSWGSDLFNFKNLGVTEAEAKAFLKRTNYLITDCARDHKIAKELGFTNAFLGTFPGNGGIEIENIFIQPATNRKTICIKGYDDGIGQALVVIKAIESIDLDSSIDFLIYSADEHVVNHLKQSNYFKHKKVEIISRNAFVSNQLLLQKMGKSMLYIGNSISDGMPNSLLEAMGMGAFPIQSNPGRVSEEVITHGVNGFLIEDPFDTTEIARLITEGLTSLILREAAQRYNVNYIDTHFNRTKLQLEIVGLYHTVNLL